LSALSNKLWLPVVVKFTISGGIRTDLVEKRGLATTVVDCGHAPVPLQGYQTNISYFVSKGKADLAHVNMWANIATHSLVEHYINILFTI
jgi:hypothetical protein